MDSKHPQPPRQTIPVGNGHRSLQVNPNLPDSESQSDGFVEEHEREELGQSASGTGLVDQKSSTKTRGGPLRKKLVKTRSKRFTLNGGEVHISDEQTGIMGAAAVLAKYVPTMFGDLCQPCLHIVQERLNGMALVGDLSPFVGDETTGEDTGKHLSFVGDEFTGESYASPCVLESLPTLANAVLATSSGHRDHHLERNARIGIQVKTSVDDGRQKYTRREEIVDSVALGQEEVAESVWHEASEDFGTGVAVRSQESVGLDGSETSMADQEVESVDREASLQQRTPLSRDQREQFRLSRVEREKDFIYLEHVNGRICNTVEGLELHKGIFSAAEQKRLVNFIYELQEKYQSNVSCEGNILSKSTGRGKTRVTIQLGKSCHYFLTEHGESTTEQELDPIPPLLQAAIRRLVKWEVLPSSSLPDSCIIIIHDEGDSISHQIQHQAFQQPTCFFPLLCDCNMYFGYKLKVLDSGEIRGGLPVSLPGGSVLVLKGRVAELAKYAMPAVSSKRISLVFRRVHPSNSAPGNGVRQGSPSVFVGDKHQEIMKEKAVREFSVSTMSPQFLPSTPASMVSTSFLSKENAKDNRAVMNPAINKKLTSPSHSYENGQIADDRSSVVVDRSVDGKTTIQSSSVSSLSWADCAESISKESSEQEENRLSRVTKEHVRFLQVGRKKDFVCLERVNGKEVNSVEGLELHTNVFNAEEQKQLVDFIYDLQERGRHGEFRERTYSEPRKWMRGKGRVTIQFGCCYNYAVDKHGNPPGIIRDDEVDPIPEMFRSVIKRLVRWHVLPRSCVPDSCIVNIYDVGDCIPPHIDHHDFFRPFCTVSLLSECNITFGSNLKIIGPGEFEGSLLVPLPVGSVLILNGNGADVAMHAVPAVPTKRISITFRKMDPSKAPYGFSPDLDLLCTNPLSHGSSQIPRMQEVHSHHVWTTVKPSSQTGNTREALRRRSQDWNFESALSMENYFPPLESFKSIENKYARRFSR